MDKKLTDLEIVKALECCPDGLCDDCPFYDKCYKNENICEYALNLINRLQAKNEDIKFLYENLKEEHLEIIKAIKHTKAEAYKEFAERLKELPYIPNRLNLHKAYDNLLKEMVSGSE